MKPRIFLAAALSVGLMTVIGVDTAAAQVNPTRASARQIQRLMTTIETKIEVLKGEAERAATRTGRQGTENVGDLGRYLDELNTSVNRLDATLDARQAADNALRETMSADT